jgi:hypothetical protein
MTLHCAVEIMARDGSRPITDEPEAVMLAGGWAVCPAHVTVALAGNCFAAANLAADRIRADRRAARDRRLDGPPGT